MRRHLAAWITLALVFAPWAAAFADDVAGMETTYERDQPLDLRADSLEYEAGRKLYVATGNVVVRQEDRELRADWLAYSKITRRGVASGNVYYTDGSDSLTASFVEFDIDTLEGVVFEAEFLNRGTLELRGAEIQKTGDRTYTFRDGAFTSCDCPDPEGREPWEVKAGEANLEIDGYGTAKNAKLEILGVPVLWVPWVILPLKTTRQTGFLMPELNLSDRSGVDIGLPFFWEVADPVGVKVTPRWLSKRGFKADLEVDYVLGEESEGVAFGAYIHDTRVRQNTRKTPFLEDRWVTTGNHDFPLPDDWRIRADYVFASDNSYANDFEDIERYDDLRYLPAIGSVTKPLGPAGAFGFVTSAHYADDLQSPDDSDRDDFLLQRLPDVSLRALPESLPFASWLAPAFDTRYIYFYQSDRPRRLAGDAAMLVTSNGRFLDTGRDGLPDSREQGRRGDEDPADRNEDNFDVGGTEGDGVFQEGELLADDGHRVVLTPRLGAPLRLLDILEFYPEVGWYETLYGSDAQGFERRGLFTARGDLRTRIRGRVGRASHLLEPRLGYAFVLDTSQGDNPLYVPRTAVPQRRVRELSLDNVTLDPADRVDEFNALTFALGNRFYDRGQEGVPLLADFVVSALYDFTDSEFGNIYLDGRLYPFSRATLRFNLGVDPRRPRVSEGLVRVGYRSDRGDRFTLAYRFLDDIPTFFESFPRENERFDNLRGEFDEINQLSGGFRLAITRQWAITYRAGYSFEQSTLLGNGGGVEYISRCDCWAARVEVYQRRNRGVAIAFRWSFVGLGDDARSPFDSGGPFRSVGWGRDLDF